MTEKSNMNANIIKRINRSIDTMEKLSDKVPTIASIAAILYEKTYQYNYKSNEFGRIFIAGNGGSALTAQHFATDFNKRLTGYPAMNCLNDNIGIITAYANDFGYDSIFKKQLENYQITEKDIFIGISYSGRSENILAALDTAKQYHATTIALTSKMGKNHIDVGLADIILDIPCMDIGIVEDMHLMVNHLLVEIILQMRSTITSYKGIVKE